MPPAAVLLRDAHTLECAAEFSSVFAVCVVCVQQLGYREAWWGQARDEPQQHFFNLRRLLRRGRPAPSRCDGRCGSIAIGWGGGAGSEAG
jgi:hypothetical protein